MSSTIVLQLIAGSLVLDHVSAGEDWVVPFNDVMVKWVGSPERIQHLPPEVLSWRCGSMFPLWVLARFAIGDPVPMRGLVVDAGFSLRVLD
jgi:hypothetical protein